MREEAGRDRQRPSEGENDGGLGKGGSCKCLGEYYVYFVCSFWQDLPIDKIQSLREKKK